MRARVDRKRIHLVPNGFAPPPDADLIDRDAARQRLGIHPDALVAVWVGRLSREKGADVMLNAIAKCDRAWRFSIIGDGPERDRLREQAAGLGIGNRITWHGIVPNAGSLLPAFDAFVLSSRTEGTPIALFEAMYAGVPIVATQVGGVPDVVAPAHAILVPSEDPRRIALALEEIARGSAATTQRVVLSRARLLQSFNATMWLASIDNVYRRVCAEHASRNKVKRRIGIR
jgi:glycosyltransferase involved in cell wall biosynthesis